MSGFSDIKIIYAFVKYSDDLEMFKAENKDCFILIKILSSVVQNKYKENVFKCFKNFNKISHLITGIFHLMNCRYHSIIINIKLHQFFF